jgi:hypothetical protein
MIDSSKETQNENQADDWAAFERAVDAVIKAPRQPQKTAPKPTTSKGEAQRRRRAQERNEPVRDATDAP